MAVGGKSASLLLLSPSPFPLFLHFPIDGNLTMMLNQLISITVLLSSKALYVSGFSTEVKSTAASAAGSKQQTSQRIAIVGAGVSK